VRACHNFTIFPKNLTSAESETIDVNNTSSEKGQKNRSNKSTTDRQHKKNEDFVKQHYAQGIFDRTST